MQMLEPLIRRATNLYTLPSVAVEVLRLTNQTDIDARTLKECIECDPALTVKILKVVNSSLFGLGSEIVDLNQAIALLGTKTLKLLVLGFSLPDKLFADVTAEHLSRYWVMALTRAVAAREIARSLWSLDGDDAFISGLLEDIGLLVLTKELGEPYSQLVESVWNEEGDLTSVERTALGFDHSQLSTALFTHWRLPEIITKAMGEPRQRDHLVRLDEPHAVLARILHLASLVAELVGRHRLDVLPDLVESGGAYIGMTKSQLDAIVERLDPAVRFLADVLSIHLPDDVDFDDVIAEAHRRMANVAEEVCIPLARLDRCDEQLGEGILADARALAETTADFLTSNKQSAANDGRSGQKPIGCDNKKDQQKDRDHRFHAASRKPAENTGDEECDSLLGKLETAVSQARAEREALSLLILESYRSADGTDLDHCLENTLQTALSDLSQALVGEGGLLASETGRKRAVILPGHDRSSAVASAYGVLRHAAVLTKGTSEQDAPGICAGIASVTIVSKNFDSERLIEAAERCLYGACQSGPGAVKSIELY